MAHQLNLVVLWYLPVPRQLGCDQVNGTMLLVLCDKSSLLSHDRGQQRQFQILKLGIKTF